jgi:predicted nuclease of predicted toxin-antitoxin system
MKLLFDQNLSYKLCSLLADLFPDSEQVGRVKLSQSSDRTIWDYAKTNGYAVVTQDADFAEMATLYGSPPKVIWLRCGNQTIYDLEMLLRNHAAELVAFAHDDTADCLEIL